MVTFLLIVAVSMAASFVCAVLEACIFSLSLTDIAKLSEKKPKAAAIWKNLRENIQSPITVIVILTTFSQTIGASLSSSQLNDLFGHHWVALYAVVFSVLMIQWTEILPKTIGIRYNRMIAGVAAVPLSFLIRLFRPLIAFFQWTTRLVEGKKKLSLEADALQDIHVLTRFATMQNLINPEQEKIVSSSIRLSRRTVGEIMVRREDMKVLSTNMSLTDALLQAHIHHHTRFPLIEGDDATNVVGYVNFKDIVNVLRLNPKDPTLRGISRPIPSVKPGLKLSAILTELTKGYQHIAVVRDDNGKVIGLITLEDIVESIVGSLNDEYDLLPTFCYPITENRFVVGGGIPLKELRKEVASALPESDMILNDWLMGQCKDKPKTEGKLKYRNLMFTVRKISRSKIHEVILDVEPEGGSAG
jgi:putative hemolysin